MVPTPRPRTSTYESLNEASRNPSKSAVLNPKAQFTSRQGNPSARVTLARELPWPSHISSIFQRRVYKAAKVSLALG